MASDPTRLVSVVIPTYNRLDVVRAAIDSALAQTYPHREVIVVDDGSEDGTVEGLRGEYGGTVTVLAEPHRGVCAARNAGIAVACGEFVAFLDSDNRWKPDHLERLVPLVLRFPEAVVVSAWDAPDSAGRWRDSEPFDPLPALLHEQLISDFSSAMCRAGPLRAVGAFDEEIVAGEGLDLWLRLALAGPFVFTHRATVAEYGVREDSLFARGRRSDAILRARAKTFEKLRRALVETERPDRDRLIEQLETEALFVDAALALHRADGDAARAAFSAAVRRTPALSTRPEIVAAAIRRYAPGVVESEEVRARTFERAADAWPDRHSFTARSLRLMAMDAAFRGGRHRALAGVVRRAPVRQLPVALRHTVWLARRGRAGQAEPRMVDPSSHPAQAGPVASAADDPGG